MRFFAVLSSFDGSAVHRFHLFTGRFMPEMSSRKSHAVRYRHGRHYLMIVGRNVPLLTVIVASNRLYPVAGSHTPSFARRMLYSGRAFSVGAGSGKLSNTS
jgi:hypothetical protein